jgi:enamine deaminase RidA (YjgF/YER057c/UK114 family)
MVVLPAGVESAEGAAYSFVDLGDSARVALSLAPGGRGPFREQAREVMAALQAILAKQPEQMTVTVQTVFLRDAADQAECEAIFGAHYGAQWPVTNFVSQPPCSGAALALEAWAIGGDSVRIERYGLEALVVSYDSVRWVHCGGVKALASLDGAYPQALDALARLSRVLARAGCGLEQVVRTWFYLGGITDPEAKVWRYQELNRARSDFYRAIRFHSSRLQRDNPPGVYPASTGIGMSSPGLVIGCLALETDREDVLLLPLENPQQTPAYAYHSKYSSQSPKFSRAMALRLGDYLTTWISGTASIVGSESCHPGDIEKQTEQTIDNIQRLIASDNFAAHGVSGAGAALHDLAKIRVYLKRLEDLDKCRAICRQRFGAVPAVYAVADICRPELLVEIEGVAFSRYSPPARPLGPGK